MIWYVARGAGVMALLMLTVLVVLGIATRQGKPLAGLPRFAIATVHRNASLLGLGLVVTHVLSLLFDSYAKLTPLDLLVPFVGTCDARGMCAELLPELVFADPWGYPLIPDERIPAHLEEHARRAARLCPRLAISLRNVSPPAPEARPHRTQWTPAGRPAPRG